MATKRPTRRGKQAKRRTGRARARPVQPSLVLTPAGQKLPAALAKLLRQIPGYDPIATAGACWFDADAAQLAIDFFSECLHFVEGARAGEPFALEEWQAAVVANLFGWKRPDGTRRYRYVLIWIARKNGKTPLAAGLVLAVLCLDDEPGAQIYGAAGSRDQAKLVFRHATGMVKLDDELRRRLKTYRASITREDGPIPSYYQVISSEGGLAHGQNAQAYVIDELHVQGSDELVDAAESAIGTRTQPIIAYLSTAGVEQESVAYEKYTYFRDVRDGVVDDPTCLPVIYEVPKDDDWTVEANWTKANPNLGVSITWDYLRGEFAKAQRLPRKENTFRRLHLNQWTEQASRWINLDAWDAHAGECDARGLAERLRGRPCWGGLDLSSTTDLSCLALVFPPEKILTPDELEADTAEPWYVLVWPFAPEDTARERSRGPKRKEAPYTTWANHGYLELTPGGVIDYGRIRRKVTALREMYDLRQLGYDPYNGEYLCNQQLGQEDGLETVAVRQGTLSMSPPSKMLEMLHLKRMLIHGGHPVLRWSVAHCAVSEDAKENIMPDKKHSTDRIDPVVATVIAISRAMVQEGAGKSVYETRGMLEL